MNQENNYAYESGESKSRWGCLLGGCLITAFVMLLLVSVGGFFGYRYVSSQIETYTAVEAQELPVVEYSKEELEGLKSQVEALKTAVENGEQPEPLELTADDINAMIAQEDDLRGKAFVRIGNGQLSGDLSIPLDGIPGAKGRFFNGSITMNVSLENGVLVVTVDDATVNGTPVPETIMKQMRSQNLAGEAYKDPKTAEVLRKFESLVIKDDKILLTPARSQAADSSATDASGESASDSGASSEQAEIAEPAATDF